MPERLERIILGLCVVAAAGYAALYLVLASQRLVYPFELEWMEPGSLEHLLRVLRGQPLYVDPTIDFVPFPYPPFYYYLAALVSQVTGPGFAVLRGISLVSSLGVAFVVLRFVQRETGRLVLGAIAAGVFLATWRASGLYFDVARLDSLFAFALLASLYLLRFQRGRAGLLTAAAAATLAVMTKQTGAVVVAPVALWCAWADWRAHGRSLRRFAEWQRFVWYGLPLAAGVGTATLLLNGIVDEHFLVHIVSVQQRHSIQAGRFGVFFGHDLLLAVPVLCVATVAWLLLLRSEPDGRPESVRAWDGFYVVALVGVLLASLIPRLKVGGAANNLIPTYAWLAVMTGVGIARLQARFASPAAARRLGLVVALALALQLAVLFRVPRGWVPGPADRAAGRALQARIAALDGEVLMPVEGYLAGRAGKRVYAHQMPVSDWARSGLAGAAPLLESYRRAVADRRFAAIVDSNTAFVRRYLGDGFLEQHYRLQGFLFEDVNLFVPISGAHIRSGTLWVPRD